MPQHLLVVRLDACKPRPAGSNDVIQVAAALGGLPNVNLAISLEGKNKAFLQQHADKLSKLENIKKYNYQYDKIAQTDKQPVTNKNKNVDIGNAANGQQNVGITGILNSVLRDRKSVV